MGVNWKKGLLSGLLVFSVGLSGCSESANTTTENTSVEETVDSSTKTSAEIQAEKDKKEQEKAAEEAKKKEAEKQKEQEKKEAEEKRKAAEAKKKKAEEAKKLAEAAKKEQADLANLEYEGTQTIDINDGIPTFSDADLSLENGAWEAYGDLDGLNRATSAEAMLNQSTMPADGEERGDISSVQPTGWKNKKIESGYLYNRSHLIGWALSAENANWKNLITGTRQLNSPEMLRFEMDVKYYLEQSTENYVRYSVTPIFRDDELLARGVHMMAQSVGNNDISFNVYIFNVQDGVVLNYADGTSDISAVEPVEEPVQEEAQAAETNQDDNQETTVYVTPTGKKYHAYAHGNGNFSPTSLENAKSMGLDPCKVCNPPE